MKFLSTLAAFALLTNPVLAAEYTIDPAQSEITFSGVHAGNTFNGVFENWNAQIIFDPADLDSSSLNATFNPATAKTGNAMYDGTLPQADWFDAKNHPEAVFKSTAITPNDDGSYNATGDLTIREITKPVSFHFMLSDLNDNPVNVSATFPIDRLAFDIGKKSDAKAEWVSKDITVTLNLQASKK